MGNVLYYQLNIDYIIETYCINKDQPELQCNGKCHLVKQLSVTDDEASGETSMFSVLHEAFYPLFFQSDKHPDENDPHDLRTLEYWTYQSNLKHLYIYDCFQPPEMAV
ncbi:MAG: hypothetical protein AAFX55_07800 [Bacteroidota bacterium]